MRSDDEISAIRSGRGQRLDPGVAVPLEPDRRAVRGGDRHVDEAGRDDTDDRQRVLQQHERRRVIASDRVGIRERHDERRGDERLRRHEPPDPRGDQVELRLDGVGEPTELNEALVDALLGGDAGVVGHVVRTWRGGGGP
jgi:hypothetical protein